MKFEAIINELEIKAEYPDEDVKRLYRPLLEYLSDRQKRSGRRLIVFLAAPPGCGKTTLAAFFEWLSLSDPSLTAIQSIGIDGFMYHKADVAKMMVEVNGQQEPMAIYKGCPESFNVSALKGKLEQIRDKDVLWPYYSRISHDSVEDHLTVSGSIVLIEGNYLLYNRAEWADIRKYGDLSLYMEIDDQTLRRRLVDRKKMGGASAEEARIHYQVSDSRNVATVRDHHWPADLEIIFDGENRIRELKNRIADFPLAQRQ